MKEKIEKLTKRVCKKWDFYKSKEVKDDSGYGGTNVTTLNGYKTEWDNPNMIWLLVDAHDGGYDGHATQVGLTKEGKFMWEYQSHCSCNSFENSSGFGDGELAIDAEVSKKSYELRDIPEDWAKIIKVNLEEILEKKWQ